MIHSKSAISSNKLHIIFNKATFKGGSTMARRKRNLQFLAGLIAGVLIGFLVKICLKNVFVYNARSVELNGMLKCHRSSRRFGSIKTEDQFALDPLKIIGHSHNETIHNSKRSLLFVGVMTAEKYLKTRANAVYRTWGKDLPGRIAFFSSEVSKSDSLPLVALKGVDDSYPPQKKSFMMLLYMHDNFIDQFEWFLRADDDVYIKTDKLEGLLRSVDSRRAQFIGQAGRGNNEEFGNLSLEYDENFCMGGPGVILSRETLKRVAPHVKECLKNLYTTHEDVELGRCVKKFAGVPCTWSYEMQSILYHNSSGSLAFTGNLKKQEVHHAITLHPVKDHKHMFRINTYLKNLKIQDLKLASISLHQDILTSAEKLELHPKNLATHYIGDSVPLYPNYQGQREYLGDTSILGVSSSLNRYHPKEVHNVLQWNFLSKVIFSPDNSNPKRRMEVSMIESIEDNIRELMENINAYSKQRGRVIEFRELLYGYQRLDPIHGADYILDILLVYKKYRGRKMTVSVRRHAYLQQSFTGIEIRELPPGESPISKPSKDTSILKVDRGFTNEDQADGLPFLNFKKINVPFKDVFQSSLLKISEKLPNLFGSSYNVREVDKKHINFILPLSGRYETFLRFLKNYEEICLRLDRRTTLIITLYKDVKHTSDFDNTKEAVERMNKKYQYSEIIIIDMEDSQFSRGLSLEKGAELCNEDSLLLFIDVDISFNTESLQRIRLNTVQYYRVYFPIVFSEYNPHVVNDENYNVIRMDKSGNSDIVIGESFSEKERDYHNFWSSDNSGYYRQFGFGIVSVYKSDFVSVGGFNTDIKGWGLEDVHLFDKFIQSNVTIFRTVDPSLVHVFHPVDCDKNLDVAQYNMCTGTRANTLGSIKHMTIFLLNHPEVLIKSSTAKPKIIMNLLQ